MSIDFGYDGLSKRWAGYLRPRLDRYTWHNLREALVGTRGPKYLTSPIVCLSRDQANWSDLMCFCGWVHTSLFPEVAFVYYEAVARFL